MQILLTIGLIFVSFILPTTDTDFGWHYRCGIDFLNHGVSCTANNFSYYLANYRWGYSSFIYDLLVAAIYNITGFWGVAFALAVVISITASLFFRLFKNSETVWLTFALFLFGSYSIVKIGFRPQVLSVLFLLILFSIIKRLLKESKTVSLPLHFGVWFVLLVWVNTHPSFILGVFVYLIYLCWLLVFRKRNFLFLALIALIFTLVNPMSYRVYTEVFNHYQTDLSKLIAEWTSPSFLTQTLIGITFFMTIIWLYSYQSTKKWFYLLILFTLAVGSLSAKRHLPLYWLTLAFVWEEFQLSQKILSYFSVPPNLVRISVILTLVLFSLFNLQAILSVDNLNQWYCKTALVELPCRQTNQLSSSSKRIFTMYEWGGYLIWKFPKAKVFVDGRMPAWITKSGKSPYTVYLEIIQAKPGWQKTLDHYQTDTLFIINGTFLDLYLANHKNLPWKLGFRDQQVAIYYRQ